MPNFTTFQDRPRVACCDGGAVPDDTVQSVIERLLARANGGSEPGRVTVRVGVADRSPDTLFAMADGRDQLLVDRAPGGRLIGAVGVTLGWTVLVYEGFCFGITPGDQIVLFGRRAGRAMWWWIEDDRLLCDYGSPLRSEAQQHEAEQSFDAEFSRLLTEVR